jgi:Holliday junction resolvase RusA-like endonuclease
MTIKLTIRVPGKPVSVNAMYRNRANGGKYLAPAAVTWKSLVCIKTREAKNLQNEKISTQPLTVICTFWGMRANTDADNLLKCTLDGLASGLGIDDKHFTKVMTVKAPKIKGINQDGAVIEVWASEAP